MTPPRKIAGPDPQYTPEALEREIQGTLVVKCTVTAQGVVRDCRVIKSVPYMDRAVIDALECRRYTPALLHGQPVEVDYSFRVQVKLPR
jgi:periplasmic protein TonB